MTSFNDNLEEQKYSFIQFVLRSYCTRSVSSLRDFRPVRFKIFWVTPSSPGGQDVKQSGQINVAEYVRFFHEISSQLTVLAKKRFVI